MRTAIILIFCLVCSWGCKLDKGESSLDKWKEESSSQAKAAVAPIDGLEAMPGSTEARRREYDEGGFHIKELVLGSDAKPEQIRAFYEPKLNAKEMPMNSGIVSIQNDMNGKHYEVTYGGGMDTISITVKTPTQ